MVDEGILDKRLLLIESEFSSMLRQADRPGNTLSPLLRDVWDRKAMLSTLTRSPLVATGALISLIGHTTREDLEAHVTTTDARNGFLNRFWILETTRAQELPLPKEIPHDDLEMLGAQVFAALSLAKRAGKILLTPAAGERFTAAYSRLSSGAPSLLGSVLSRGPAHVRRMAVIYALTRSAKLVDACDIESALALWRECENSVRSIFGTRTGDRLADRNWREMAKGSQYSLTELRARVLGTGDVRSDQLRTSIEALLDAFPDEFTLTSEKTKGRSKEILARR